jgi:WD40 repeat protein
MTAAFQVWLLAALAPLPTGQAREEPKPLLVIPVLRDGERFADLQRMEYSPDGRYLVVRRSLSNDDNRRVSQDAVLEAYDPTTAKLVRSCKIDNGGNGLDARGAVGFAISPKSDWVAYGDRHGLNFVSLPPSRTDVPRGRRVSAKGAFGSFLHAGAWTSGDGSAIYLGYHSGGSYSLYRVEIGDANPARGELLLSGGRLAESDSGVASAFNPTAGRYVAVVRTGWNEQHSLECWVLGAKPEKTTIKLPRSPSCVALSPDGKTVASGSLDGSLAWHDAETGREIRRVPPLGRFGVFALAFHPGGKFLACGTTDKRGDQNVRVLNLATGEVVARLVAAPMGVTGVRFSPTGDKLATFGTSGEVRIWDATALLKLERD